MSTQVEPLKPHPLLDESGSERSAIFLGEHSDRIGGMDCLTGAIEPPSEVLSEDPRSIARWTACGPRGLVEATLEFMEQWAQAAKSRLPWQPIAFSFSGSSVNAGSESGLGVGAGPGPHTAISAAIEHGTPNLPGRHKVQ